MCTENLLLSSPRLYKCIRRDRELVKKINKHCFILYPTNKRPHSDERGRYILFVEFFGVIDHQLGDPLHDGEHPVYRAAHVGFHSVSEPFEHEAEEGHRQHIAHQRDIALGDAAVLQLANISLLSTS